MVVIIIDDDDAVRTGFVRLMSSAGIKSLAYDCAESFLADVKQETSTCILLDITMPSMTGPEVQARLNAMNLNLPVITISATDDEGSRDTARALGARMFLSKPIDDQALLDAIRWVTNTPIPSKK